MTSKRVTLTHPNIPGSAFAAFDFQVDLYKARGWKVADAGDQKPAEAPAPAKKTATKTPAVAPADTRKES